MGLAPPALQRVSLFRSWLLVQRRRLAGTLGADAGGERPATGGNRWREGGVSLFRSLLGLEVERGEGPLCEIE